MSITTSIKRMWIYAALAAIFVFAASAVSQNPIVGEWKISGYGFSEKRDFPIDKLSVTLSVDRNMHIGGRSGCNVYSGNISIGTGNAIRLESITSSDMACREMEGSFEGAFLDVLSNASQYEVKGGMLTITAGSTGNFLRFAKAGVSKPPSAKPSPAKHEIFYVSNKTGNCPIIAPLKCLLVKQEKDKAWKEYYDQIIGFKFKPGLFYKIEVKRVGDEPSGLPGDVTVYRHKLVRVIKTSVREKDIYH